MSKEKPQQPAAVFKYKDLKSFDFGNLMAKLSNTPTVNARANHIRHVIKEYQRCEKEISDQFDEEIVKVFSLKNEDGTTKLEEVGNPNSFQIDPDKQDAFTEASKVFGDKEIAINYRPFTPDTLADIKLTAKELNILGDLFTEESGPGIPHLQMQR